MERARRKKKVLMMSVGRSKKGRRRDDNEKSLGLWSPVRKSGEKKSDLAVQLGNWFCKRISKKWNPYSKLKIQNIWQKNSLKINLLKHFCTLFKCAQCSPWSSHNLRNSKCFNKTLRVILQRQGEIQPILRHGTKSSLSLNIASNISRPSTRARQQPANSP